jgi:hypothetical protein
VKVGQVTQVELLLVVALLHKIRQVTLTIDTLLVAVVFLEFFLALALFMIQLLVLEILLIELLGYRQEH